MFFFCQLWVGKCRLEWESATRTKSSCILHLYSLPFYGNRLISTDATINDPWKAASNIGLKKIKKYINMEIFTKNTGWNKIIGNFNDIKVVQDKVTAKKYFFKNSVKFVKFTTPVSGQAKNKNVHIGGWSKYLANHFKKQNDCDIKLGCYVNKLSEFFKTESTDSQKISNLYKTWFIVNGFLVKVLCYLHSEKIWVVVLQT